MTLDERPLLRRSLPHKQTGNESASIARLEACGLVEQRAFIRQGDLLAGAASFHIATPLHRDVAESFDITGLLSETGFAQRGRKMMRIIEVGLSVMSIVLLTTSVTYAQRHNAIEAKLMALDRDRCQAITDANWVRFAELMADDLVHVHSNGRIEDKQTVIAGMQKSRRTTYRGDDVNVRVYGEFAVMTGTQFNRSGDAAPQEFVMTQVWVRQGGVWRQVSLHSARKSAP